MAWKASGQPTVRIQRDKWVVRVDGLDTETGRARPRQLGTFASQRSARAAAAKFTAAGDVGGERGTVGELVRRWVTSRLDVSAKTRLQYEWAAERIATDIGAIRVDRLDRDDIARWLDGLASGGKYSRRSVGIFRMVLRAALADAVESGELRRSPAARVGMPKKVVKPGHQRDAEAWTEEEVDAFLAAIAGHRWAPIALSLFYGLRRSELLGLRWSAVDLRKHLVRIEHALIESPRPTRVERGQERSLPTNDSDRCRQFQVAGRSPTRAGPRAA